MFLECWNLWLLVEYIQFHVCDIPNRNKHSDEIPVRRAQQRDISVMLLKRCIIEFSVIVMNFRRSRGQLNISGQFYNVETVRYINCLSCQRPEADLGRVNFQRLCRPLSLRRAGLQSTESYAMWVTSEHVDLMELKFLFLRWRIEHLLINNSKIMNQTSTKKKML